MIINPTPDPCVCGGVGFMSDHYMVHGWGHTFTGQCSKCRRTTGSEISREMAFIEWNKKQAKLKSKPMKCPDCGGICVPPVSKRPFCPACGREPFTRKP